jgi:hypothetical protein
MVSAAQTQASVGSLTLSPNEGEAGARVVVLATGFRAGETISLEWQTIEATVTVVSGYMYGGHNFQNRTIPLGDFVANSTGSVSTSIQVPYDYGGYHQVVASGSEGDTASFTFYTIPQLSMSPSNGQVGTKITFRGNGFGWTVGLDDAWQVDYDNKYLGYFTALESNGNVSFSIYASGDTGLHRISVYANPYGPTYLNLQEAFPEFAQLPRFNFDFQVTQGEPKEPTSATSSNFTPPTSPIPTNQGASIIIDPSSGNVGTMLSISGAGFRPEEDVNLNWTSVVGAYISPTGFMNTSISILHTTADSSGKFTADFRSPYDVGGSHTIQAHGSLGSVANSSFYITRSAEVSPTSGPPGTTITIHIYGVGWKSWENIATVDYDNAYTGYACALGSQPGNITIFLTALGAPGLHTIDLYPSIFRGPPTINYRSLGGTEPDVYRFPLLTPSELPEPLPIFHFEFIVTGQSQNTPASVNFNVQYLVLLIPVAVVALALFVKIRAGTKSPTAAKAAKSTRLFQP